MSSKTDISFLHLAMNAPPPKNEKRETSKQAEDNPEETGGCFFMLFFNNKKFKFLQKFLILGFEILSVLLLSSSPTTNYFVNTEQLTSMVKSTKPKL
ncbi:hypothetical protein J6590_106127, partial [Homalodisca vitripennis]